MRKEPILQRAPMNCVNEGCWSCRETSGQVQTGSLALNSQGSWHTWGHSSYWHPTGDLPLIAAAPAATLLSLT